MSNLKDIYKNFNYQIQRLSSRRNNDLGKYTSNILRTLQNKEQNESALLRKYNKAINDFDLKLGDGKENIIKKKLLDLKKKRYELLSSIYQNESLVDKNRIDFSTLFYNFINENSSSIEINMAYFPDYYLYYNFLTNNDNFRSIKKN